MIREVEVKPTARRTASSWVWLRRLAVMVEAREKKHRDMVIRIIRVNSQEVIESI